MNKRCVGVLNKTLHKIFEERKDVYLIGEDIVDPYGGAFKVTRGLSGKWPDRVITTPISEAALLGVTAGMALRGLRPICEIMFGDFITLGFDQIVNHISKFHEMYNGKVNLSLVIRTPMGGRRGYGPTHSQSLEKFLMGVPHITVIAISEYHNLEALLTKAVLDDGPVFFIENKIIYGKNNQRPEGRYIDCFQCRETNTAFSAITFSGNEFSSAEITIVTYGGMVSIALEAVKELIIEDEIFCEVVALSQLLPLDMEPILSSVKRTGRLLTVEEGGLTGGVGAEITARTQEAAWNYLDCAVKRVAAIDTVIPASPTLENAVLPGKDDIIRAVRAICKSRR